MNFIISYEHNSSEFADFKSDITFTHPTESIAKPNEFSKKISQIDF